MEFKCVGPGFDWFRILCHLPVLLLLSACFVSAAAADYPPAYPANPKVSFACENSYAYLNCNNKEERIRIMRANYGRFSLVVCNQDGIHDGWELQCASNRSTQIVGERCDGSNNCTFMAANSEFGDPCPGTKKYIEVRYICERESDTTKAPSTTVSTEPPTTTSTPTSPSTASSSSDSTTVKTTPLRTSPVTSKKPRPTKRPSWKTTAAEQTTQAPVGVIKCSRTMRAGVRWPQKSARQIAEMDCPNGKKGVALWKCGVDGWVGKPDLSNCVSAWTSNIKSKMKKDVQQAVKSLNIEIKKTKYLDAGDLKATANNLLPGLLENLKIQMEKINNSAEKREKVQTFTKEVVKTGSQLLGNNQKKSWQELELTEKRKSATQLIICMEEIALEVAKTVDVPGTVISIEENILMEVSLVEVRGHHRQDITFPSKQQGNSSWRNKQDSVVLPLDGLQAISRKREVSLTFLLYRNLETLMNPSDDDILADDTRRARGSNWVVNTDIISASVNGRKIRSPAEGQQTPRLTLGRPMTYTLDHNTMYDSYQPACAFWDFNEVDKIGHWSEEGCRVVTTSKTQTVCQCDHLTNFAVLMDVSGIAMSPQHELSLKAITYVGCTVSIICLFISFVSFSVFRNLQSDRNTIHKNLVLCLMLAEILFVFGIGQTEYKIVCAIVAGCLHFLFLTSFAWMCLEGIQLYFMLIEVFESERSRVRWFYLFGYGMPALIVAIAAGVDHTGYGTEFHCWLRSDNYFILSFIIPAAIVVLINIAMLSIAVHMMCRHANVTATAIRSREKGRLEKLGDHRPLSNSSAAVSDRDNKRHLELPTWLKGSAVLVVLLGLTWCFGFMYVNADSIFMAYIFTILNSLQGLFIFIFHCVMDRKVKKEVRKSIQRSSWLPNVIRVNFGGYNGNLSSPTPTSSTGQNWYFLRFWSSRKRKRSSASSGSGKSRRLQSDLDSFIKDSSSGSSTTGTGVNRYSNQSEKLIQNDYTKLPTCYEDGVKGDLSIVDCSVVDSEFVSTYCKENLQVSREEREYSSGSDDEVEVQKAEIGDNVSVESLSKNRLSFLSQDSALKFQSDFASSDNEDGGVSMSDLSRFDQQRETSKDSSSNRLSRGPSGQSESETNLLNNLLDYVHRGKVGENGRGMFPSLDDLDATDNRVKETTNKSAPDLKSLQSVSSIRI